MTTKRERFAEFLSRLAAAPAVGSYLAARQLLDTTLNAIEDELSDVHFNPDNWRDDGRMYPVQDDNISPDKTNPNIMKLKSRGHLTFIAPNGAIEIKERGGPVLFEKPGTDGKGVWDA